MQPSQIPAHVLIDPGEAPGGAVMLGPGTLAGGPDGIPNGMADTIAPPRIEPPPKPRPATSPAVPRVRVGGVVQAARLIRQVKPVYPPLARQARIGGVVMLEAVIAKDGTIRSLHLISGHPLLVRSAVDAVEQWMYRPTLLNGEPAEVLTQIEVRFTISE